VRPEGLSKLEKLIHLIGSGTRDLPADSIVPYPPSYRVPLASAKHVPTVVDTFPQFKASSAFTYEVTVLLQADINYLWVVTPYSLLKI
jgi:hypothetical protein